MRGVQATRPRAFSEPTTRQLISSRERVEKPEPESTNSAICAALKNRKAARRSTTSLSRGDERGSCTGFTREALPAPFGRRSLQTGLFLGSRRWAIPTPNQRQTNG